MSKAVTAFALAAAFATRYPNAAGGMLDSVSASAATVDSISAAAVKGFSAVSGPLTWVKAVDNFYVGGELLQTGDFVQVQEEDARRLIQAGRAVLSTDEEAAKAQKASK